MSEQQRCVECGEEVDSHVPTLYYETLGFAQKRQGGGLHGLKFRSETGRVMHAACAYMRASRERQGMQEQLL